MESFDDEFATMQKKPFKEPLYFVPSWQKQMDLIGHLIQTSQNLLVLTGQKGVGKTSFTELFVDYKCQGIRKVMLQASVLYDTESLMKAIAHGFRLPWPVESLPRPFNAQQKEAEAPVWTVIIDDADNLTDDVLTALLSLVDFNLPPASQLRIVLVGSPVLEARLQEELYQDIIDDKLHIIEVSDWDLEDINWVLHERHLDVPPSYAEQIFDQTLGAPSKVLSKLQEGHDIKPLPNKRESMHWTVKLVDRPIVLGVVIGVFAGLSFMVLNWDDDQGGNTHPTNIALEETVTSPTISKERQVLASNQKAENQVEPMAQWQNPSVKQSKEAVQQRASSRTELQGAKQVVSASNLPNDDDVWSLSSAEQTILSEKSDYYTLQLVGASEATNVEQFIKKKNLDSKAKLARSSLSGKKWYVVLYGSYPSLESAKLAAKEIYNDQKIKPWIRTYGSVQNDLQERVNSDKG